MRVEPGATARFESDVVAPGSVVAEPWSNGVGITRVLARRLGWRLSVADIRGAHRFSHFPGLDRLLLVAGDQPLGLTIDGQAHRLDPGQGVEFAGEARVVPAPTALGATVVNLITSRALTTTRWALAAFDGSRPVRADETSVVVVLTGDVRYNGVLLPHGTAFLPSERPRTVTGRGVLGVLTIESQRDALSL